MFVNDQEHGEKYVFQVGLGLLRAYGGRYPVIVGGILVMGDGGRGNPPESVREKDAGTQGPFCHVGQVG